MNNFKSFLALTLFCVSLSASALAGVTFLPAAEGSVGSAGNSSNMGSADKCRSEGYSVTSCSSNEILADKCPYNSGYYKSCCPSEYRYTQEECTNAGLHYSRGSCGGLYKCS